jgi:viologen exporter family transport system permease protein
MLRIYRRFWQVNWAEQWQYRANLLMYLLYWLVSPIVYLSVWTTIARSQGSVNGLTANDFITYYLTVLVVDQMTSEITIHLLADKIQDGTLSSELLRPVHPILTNTLVNNLAFKSLIFAVFVPVWLALFVLFRPDYSGVSLQSVLLALPAFVLGFGINFLLGATLTCLAFWTTRVYSISEFYFALSMLFSGQFVPLALLPPVVQRVADFLPFQFYIYFPVQIILGRLPPEGMLRTYGLGAVWLVFAYLVFRSIWRAGVKRFSAVGA